MTSHATDRQSRRHSRNGTERGQRRTPASLIVLLVLTGLLAAAVATGAQAPSATAQGTAPEGAGFNLNASDLRFILRQIQISEHHAETGEPLLGDGPFQVESASLPFGLRTVDGSLNNLVGNDTPDEADDQAEFGAADNVFPRMTSPLFRDAEPLTTDLDGPAPGTQSVGDATSYKSNKGFVEDSQPRLISNLIVDQTSGNPAAVAAAGPGAEPEGGADGPLFIGNTAPDVGLSAPFNSWFTLFGQFFDHGLDLTNKGGGTVYMPLKDGDPLIAGPDHILVDDPDTGVDEAADNLPPHLRFMVLTRATNRPGNDGVLGTGDDVKEATNQTTSFVDQNQTYTSHPSHQVFLREYDATDAATEPPALTGRMLDGGAEGGLATWARVKAQARNELGIQLSDLDVLNVPLLRTDAYGRFLAGPNGYPQIVLAGGGVLDGDPAADGGNGVPVPANAVRTGHGFLDDIAHHAAPRNSRGQALTADGDPGTGDDGIASTYDDEMLNAHFLAGDGRTNENIGLTAVHSVFHSEHNRLVADIDSMIQALPATEQAAWKDATTTGGEYWDYGERLFQAARFVTEMEYQHLVFEEFGRKVQPQVNVFAGYDENIDPSIVAEFAHTVYRFGHSMLNEGVDRQNADGSRNDIGLIDAFLDPPEFLDGGTYATAHEATGAIARGMTRQVGNEIDEFVTEALRNNLLGLPLDLATINLARGRDTGIPPLNEARRQFYAATNNAALRPYESWVEFGSEIRHVESLENFVAAYGRHESILDASTAHAKRLAARALIAGGPGAPGDSADFIEGTGTWAGRETGLNLVDFWVGGLAEKQMPFGGLLGNTMNFVFETQLENLQDGDRFYYLSRTAGLNLLVQLEGNSFAELVMRNSDASGLPADAFSRPDFSFDLAAQTDPNAIVDDPATAWDETELLVRMANGTIRFNGPEHVIWNGTDGPPGGDDEVWSSEGDDTLRGDGGNDRMEGAAGNDQFLGGLGNDILTDSFGDDVLKGGVGHDTLSSGQGFDLNQGGRGDDFVIGGSDPTETFGGQGDDTIFAGGSSDTVFGDDGDDWIQGGGQADLLQGDNGAPFQNDPNEPGNDVIIGEGGNDDYDAEGGDDVMVAGPGIERNEGMLGFDWVTHKGDPQPADDDMFFTGLLPPTLDTLRDRFDLTEALSGHDKNDALRGDNRLAADLVDDALDEAGIARIDGLQDVLGAGATSFDGGNILLGGAGSDLLEGRGGDDILDGDKWLNVQLRVPDLTIPGATKLVDSLTQVQADVLAGRIDGGQIEIVRRIETSAPGLTSVDTAVFSGPRADYDVANRGGSVIVTHARGTQTDGVDRLSNVERLAFDGGLTVVELSTIAGNQPPTGTLTISDTTPTENQALTVTAALNDPDGIASAIDLTWQALTAPDTWVAVGQGATFAPGDFEVGRPLRVVATFLDGDGVQESFLSADTAGVINVNDVPTGAPVLADTTPQEGVTLSASTATIADGDGLGTFSLQWQQSGLTGTGAFTDIAGQTGPTIDPAQAQVNRSLRLVVSFTDGHGTPQQVLSAPTGVVGDLFQGTAANDSWTGTAGDDRAFGAGGSDTLTAGAGNDELSGEAGDDTVNGGDGNDVVRFTGTGDGFDAVTGGNGTDRAEATADGTIVGLRSLATTEQISGATFAGVRIRGSAAANTLNLGAVTLTSIVDIDGGAGGDTITGSAAADTILGGTGNDTIDASGGDDVVRYAPGDGSDAVNGGSGTDRLEATAANTVIGLRTLSGVEAITGAGARVLGDGGANSLNLSTVTLSSVVDIDGGAGNDTLLGAPAAETVRGGAGDDTINTGGGNDVIQVGAGHGIDSVNGGTGTDRVEATANSALIGLSSLSAVESITAGGRTGVRIVGSAANNTLNFSAVTLTGIVDIGGEAGNDTLTGSPTADVIIGGSGNDALNGAGDKDRFVFRTGSGSDTVTGFDSDPGGSGQDLLDVTGLGVTAGSFSSSVVIRPSPLGGTLITIGTSTIRLTVVNPATVTIADFVVG